MGRGHNHYLDCGCNWCCSTGGVRIKRADLQSSMSQRDAERVFQRYSASHGRSACFVIPNAQCPVCHASVFYYQNAFGSRVFFDELGPTWLKHPCTDNSNHPGRRASVLSDRPALRKRGARMELVEAATSLRIYSGARSSPLGYAVDWQLLHVRSVRRRGMSLLVEAQLIEMADDAIVHFSLVSPHEILQPDDLVSACYSTISLIHPEKLVPRSYEITWFSGADFAAKILTGAHILKPVDLPTSPAVPKQPSGRGPMVLIPKHEYRPPKRRNQKKIRKISGKGRPLLTPIEVKPAHLEKAPKRKSKNQINLERIHAELIIERKGERRRLQSTKKSEQEES